MVGVKEAGGDRCDIVNERWSNREAYKDNKRTGYDDPRVSRAGVRPLRAPSLPLEIRVLRRDGDPLLRTYYLLSGDGT